MEGCALAAMLPPWSYKSELLTPKPEAYHHLHFEGHHPRQGDKQEKTVLPCMWQSSNTIRAGHMHHIALCCLEGSTPEDGSGANTQAAPVGRRMCGILYPGYRFALPWAKCLLPFQGAYLGRTMRGWGFISVYRLAMDARPWRGDGVAD